MCCSTLTLGQKNTKKTNTKPHILKKEKGGGKRKISERSHLFFRALSNYSKTYFPPGLSCLKETVFPVVTGKGFGVG